MKTIAAALLLLGLSISSAQAVDLGTKVALQIPPQALATALIEFSRQTQLQIMSPGIDLSRRQSVGVTGQYTISQALDQLLIGTDLHYDPTGPNTIAVKVVSQPHAAVRDLGTADRNADQLVRVAQMPAQDQTHARGERQQAEAERQSEQEIVVTGTNIRGVRNETSPVISFDRDYIERSGYSNAQQMIDSLPQNFKGGASGASEEGIFMSGSYVSNNETRASGANLRGLGAMATLTLINGRRVAPSANGQFVDITSIPLSAVERVEVLTDGASAVYGADAVAGVINIILRKNFDGAETSLRYGSVTEGSMAERQASQTIGKSWSGGSAVIVGEYYSRDSLSAADRDFAAGAFLPNDLFPRRERANVMVNLAQALPAKFDLAANVLYSSDNVNSWGSSTTNSFKRRRTGDTTQWTVFAGLGYAPFSDWRFELGTVYSRLRPLIEMYTATPAGVVLSYLRDFHEDFDQRSLDFKSDGTIWRTRAGATRLAIGASYREDDFHSSYINAVSNTTASTDVELDVKSVFAELYVPVIAAEQNVRGMHRLDISAAGRYDDYSLFGSTTNPKIGLVWSPVEALDVRASYSTSYRAPMTIESRNIGNPANITVYNLANPAGSGNVPVFLLGGTADLKAEESENRTVGLTFRPRSIPGLKLSLDYFDIDYTDRIQSAPFDANVLRRPAELGSLISTLPDDAAALAYRNAIVASGGTVLDSVGTGHVGVRYIYDVSLQNTAWVKTNGFDLGADYRFTVGQNGFNVSMNLTHLGEILNAVAPGSAAFDTLDTFSNPLDWRMRALGSWTRGGLSTSLAVNYSDSYLDNTAVVTVPISSWTTIDTSLIYDFGADARLGLLSGVRASLSITNVLDEDPPLARSVFAVGFDPANASSMGRFAAFQLSKRW